MTVPQLKIDGRAVHPSRVTISEVPRGATLQAEFPLPVAGSKSTAITFGTQSQKLFTGKLISRPATEKFRNGRNEQRCLVRAGVDQSEIDSLVSFSLLDSKRETVVSKLLPGAKNISRGIGNNERLQAICWSEHARVVGARFALAGGQLLVSTGLGEVILCRPDKAAKAQAPEFFEYWASSLGSWQPPGLLIGTHPDNLKKSSAHKLSELPTLFRLFEASCPQELRAAGKALAAAVDFKIVGGAALLAIAPGDFVKDGTSSSLVTERHIEWTRQNGWTVTLLGRYPTGWLKREPRNTFVGKVTDFNAKKGLIKVACQTATGPLEVWTSLRADRANGSQFVGGLPKVGDIGIAQFLGCYLKAVYLGSCAIPGTITEEDFKEKVHVVRVDKAKIEFSEDGSFEKKLGSQRSDYGEEFMATGRTFDFRKN